ncbi:hypothetical protein BGS_0274 [Beggiatoa sp. SS]|nr:hypothetical protein BGS_0274 [Beggiatoa sp. SS]
MSISKVIDIVSLAARDQFFQPFFLETQHRFVTGGPWINIPLSLVYRH